MAKLSLTVARIMVCGGSCYSKKVKQSVTGLEWPTGFQEFKVPRLHDNGTG